MRYLMKLTAALIGDTLAQAQDILKKAYPEYTKVVFPKVRISKTRTKWASVKNQVTPWGIRPLELVISNIFEEIPDERKAALKLKNTLIHECIHTIPGCQDHGKKFKYIGKLVQKVDSEMIISRASAAEDFDVVLPTRQKREVKYVITCPDCGKQYFYKRMPRYHISTYSCPYCHCSNLTISGK